jgi:hypothetical protein
VTALSAEQPYPGLRPFDLGDEAFFFGREAQTRALREKLKVSRLIAVVGRSGCGKSSLVRAGLVPLLLQERGADDTPSWRIATLRPQGRPMRELADALLRLKAEMRPTPGDSENAEMQALRQSRMEAMLRRNSLGLVDAARELNLSASAGLLIIVDQFEEIFRFEGVRGSDADEATAFVRLLLAAMNAASPRVYVILTMRLDFLGDCARFQGLPEALSEGQFLVPNLSRAERRAAIEEPAKKCGATISPAVTQRLLNEIGDDPDQLPVLQHVLMRTWQEAKGECDIQLSHYEATGGVGTAISRHADDVFGKLASDEQREIAERMFKAISELDRRGRAIRRALPFADIVAITGAPEDSVSRVVEAFRAPDCCFLMPPAGQPLNEKTPVDISHESLLRGWKKMMGEHQGEGWLAEEDRDGKIYRSLLDAAEAFEKDASAVLPRGLTRQRENWWKQKQPNAAWAERYGGKFELVSELLRQSARRQRIVGWSAGAMAALLFLTISGQVGWYFYGQYQDQVEQDRAREVQNALDYQQSREAAAEAAARKQEIDGLQRQIAGLREQLRAGGLQWRADETAQQVAVATDARQVSASSAVTNQDGYMWVGSVQKSNLTQDGQPVPPPQVRKNEQYTTVPLNIFLRSGLPDESYVQQPSVGVVAPNSRVQALDVPVSFERPTGQQYWLKVRVLTSVSLPTVYFQYTAAPQVSAPARALSQKLKTIGYKLPGEERVEAAQGRREVRYFYAPDRDDAEKLAQDTMKALADLGFPDKPPVTARSMLDFSGKKNAPGVLELWLDLTPKAAAK